MKIFQCALGVLEKPVYTFRRHTTFTIVLLTAGAGAAEMDDKYVVYCIHRGA